jgi:hypothetical protein
MSYSRLRFYGNPVQCLLDGRSEVRDPLSLPRFNIYGKNARILQRDGFRAVSNVYYLHVDL